MDTSVRLAVFAAAAVVVVTGSSAALAFDSHVTSTPQVRADAPLTPPGASITVENHSSGGQRVLVDSATLPEGGFVAIYDERNGTPEIIGVTPYLDAGEHSGTIRLGRVPGAAYNLTHLGTDATLVVRLHRDTDGDKRFDNLSAPGTDGAYLAGGEPTEARTRVTVPEDRRPATPSVDFANQTSNDRTVEVASATLPDGGFVVLHTTDQSGGSPRNTSSNPEPGFLHVPERTSGRTNRSAIATSGYLPPGSYTDLRLSVAGEALRNATRHGMNATARLTAVVYNDTDANHEFGPSEIGGDRPERADGELVADTASVRIESPQTGGETATATTGESTAGTPTTPPARTATRGERTSRNAPTPTPGPSSTPGAPTTATPTRSERTARGTSTARGTVSTATNRTPTQPSTRTPSEFGTSPEPTTAGATTARPARYTTGPGIIADSNTDTGSEGPKNGVNGNTPYGGTDHERSREVILNDPLFSAFGVVVVVFAALAVFDWRRGSGGEDTTDEDEREE